MLVRGSSEARVLRPLVFTRPVRLAWPPSWAAHIPFAFWVVDVLRPRRFVELGTQSGVSYSAFVQAVQALGLDTACYAVDTWAGDEQAGYYDESVYEEWAAFHDRHFAGTSRLVRSTFDAAVEKFSDGAIDLLHIDGLHTYDAVRHDFETWLPKLSARAVVLFHDINVREGEFGAWKVWEELSARHPSFAFVHGHGLGVLAVGRQIASDVAWLMAVEPEEAATVQRVFSTVGDLWVTHIMLDRARDEAALAAAQQATAADENAAAANRANAAEARAAALAHEMARVSAELEEHRRAAEEAAAHQAELDARLAEQTAQTTALQEELARAAATETAPDAVLEDRQGLASMVSEPRDTDGPSAEPLEEPRRRSVLRQQIALGELEASRRERTALRLAFASSARSHRASVRPDRGIRRQLAAAGLDRHTLVRSPLHSARALAVLAHPGFRQNAMLLAASGLFDPAFYGAQPETARIPRPRLREHFIRHGDRAGISPHPLFESRFYREQNPDLPADARLLFHYLRYGSKEGRHPHPLFQTDYYLRQAGRRAVAALSPLTDYLEHGAGEGLSPHPLFDTGYYLRQHPALVAAGHHPLLNYFTNGFREGFDPHPLFSSRFYLEANRDLGSDTNPLHHFARYGAFEGRAPHPLFDVAYYWQQRPDIRSTRTNALVHYLEYATLERIDPHPLFDTAHYLEQLPDSARGDVNPLLHFVDAGWRQGFTPNPWFDPLWYAASYADLDPSINPLAHYVRWGWRERRDPSPQFSTARYLEEHPDAAEDPAGPLAHFLRRTRSERGVPMPAPATGAGIAPPVLRVTGTATAPKTIVVVSHVAPWPVRAGNEYRVRRLLRHWVNRGYRVGLVLAPIPAEPLADGAFERIVDEFGNVILCQPDGEVRFHLRDFPDAVSPLAGLRVRPGMPGVAAVSEADRLFCHDVVQTVTASLVRSLGRVVVVAEYIFMTRLLPLTGERTLKIVDTHDVFSQKAANVVAYGIGDVETSEQAEAEQLRRADVVVAIHGQDAAALARLVPDREVLVAGVDAEVADDQSWPADRAILVVGSGNTLNIAGLRDFLRFAWPRIRAAEPRALLRVAGAVGRIVAPGTPGVERLGHVADLSAAYRAARVVINPTVAGTGLKIKTIEALAHLRPVVGWPHNRDGLSERLAPFAAESRDWYEFADQVVGLLQRDASPFDARATAGIRAELSAEAVYGVLDHRLDAFFSDANSYLRPE